MAIKTRTAKTSPNTAGTKRREAQEAAAKRNKEEIANAGQFSTVVTPWEKSKAKRLYHRKLAGKTYENWLKKSSKASKYKDNGKHAIKPGTGVAYNSVSKYGTNPVPMIDHDRPLVSKSLTEYQVGVITKIGATS